MIRTRKLLRASKARRLICLLLIGLLSLMMLTHIPATAQEGGAPESWCASSGQQEIPDGECRALEALFRNTGGPAWTDSSGWLSSTAVCSEWRGLTCGGSHVTEIALVANNLGGTLPAEIGDLSALTHLDLTGNRISGSIPSSIGALSALSDLSLGGNMLEGPIPGEIGELTALVALDLGDNRLTGEIPPALGTLPELSEMLYLDGNRLQGPIPTSLCQRSYALASLNYNLLDYFATDESCDLSFAGWQDTQTTGPAGVAVEVLNVEAQTGDPDVSGEVLVQWLPISYDSGKGGYEVFTRHLAGGAVQLRARIEDKTADSLRFAIEDDPNAYSYFVRAWTAAHENNQSTLSGDSEDVRIRSMPLRLPAPTPDDSLLFLPALVLPALLLLALIGTAVFRRRRL